MRLQGKVAIVTGGSGGIGHGICLALGAARADVAVNYCTNAAAAEQVAASLREMGRRALAVYADVSDTAQALRLVQTTADALGPPGILINNAGIDLHAPFLDIDEATWGKVIDTNLKGAFFCSQEAARHMRRAGWGRIINISSVHGLRTRPQFAHYAASKGGIDALTRALALELAEWGITVNGISPGYVDVERQRSLPDYDLAVTARHIPVQRVGLPADVAHLAVYLASEDAGFVTGQVLCIDGGATVQLCPESLAHYPKLSTTHPAEAGEAPDGLPTA
jgi:NAD(P)-dependent dehydrogenase (short-subunit alcohol dehydrogenase family)